MIRRRFVRLPRRVQVFCGAKRADRAGALPHLCFRPRPPHCSRFHPRLYPHPLRRLRSLSLSLPPSPLLSRLHLLPRTLLAFASSLSLALSSALAFVRPPPTLSHLRPFRLSSQLHVKNKPRKTLFKPLSVSDLTNRAASRQKPGDRVDSPNGLSAGAFARDAEQTEGRKQREEDGRASPTSHPDHKNPCRKQPACYRIGVPGLSLQKRE